MIDRTSVLFCPGCHGIAIPEQSLQAVIAKRAAGSPQSLPPASTPDLASVALCPSCKGPMERHLHRGESQTAVIDTCDHCRLNWLEYSQLDRIAHCAAMLASFA